MRNKFNFIISIILILFLVCIVACKNRSSNSPMGSSYNKTDSLLGSTFELANFRLFKKNSDITESKLKLVIFITTDCSCSFKALDEWREIYEKNNFIKKNVEVRFLTMGMDTVAFHYKLNNFLTPFNIYYTKKLDFDIYGKYGSFLVYNNKVIMVENFLENRLLLNKLKDHIKIRETNF